VITLQGTVLLPTLSKEPSSHLSDSSCIDFENEYLRNVGGQTPYFNNSALLHLIKNWRLLKYLFCSKWQI